VQPGETTIIHALAEEPVVTGGLDLELLEVRQLDRGDLARNLGPAYRVMLRNRTGEAVVQPFNVGLAASFGRVPAADSAYAVERATGLEAGETLRVDVRLPAAAYYLGHNAEGQAVAFSWLTAVVDSHQELPDVDRQNDFLTLHRSEVVMLAEE
jgi:hypothetical protein